jgi:hypothetical protein
MVEKNVKLTRALLGSVSAGRSEWMFEHPLWIVIGLFVFLIVLSMVAR